jgi:CTP:molybdopterin cytidylyltransferase MocA
LIGAIVLAAGAGSRIGRPKALLTLGPTGPTFVDAIAETLRTAGVPVWRIVVAPGFAPRRAQDVVNPDPSLGMLSSIQCGLADFAETPEAVLVWPVDHPLVVPATVGAIIAAFRRGKAPVVVPTYGGRRGHPVLFAARVFPEILAADRSRGAREVVHAHDDRLELGVNDPGVVEDIDTTADYERVFGASIAPSSAGQ